MIYPAQLSESVAVAVTATASATVVSTPVWYQGVTLRAGTAAADLRVYSGAGSGSAALIHAIYAGANAAESAQPPAPVYCNTGIMLVRHAKMDSAVVYYQPVSGA